MKKIISLVAVALVVSGAALGGYAYHQQSQINPAILENIEALTNYEDSWWDSKVYNCVSTTVWVWDCMFFKDIPRSSDDIYSGPTLSPYDLCCGYFKMPKIECVKGNSVAHCWDC